MILASVNCQVPFCGIVLISSSSTSTAFSCQTSHTFSTNCFCLTHRCSGVHFSVCKTPCVITKGDEPSLDAKYSFFFRSKSQLDERVFILCVKKTRFANRWVQSDRSCSSGNKSAHSLPS